MFNLAIFDLDGTLLDTIEDLAIACNRALRLSGYPEHPQDAYKLFVGNGVHTLILRAMPPAIKDNASIQKVEALFNEYYSAHSQDKTKPYGGIVDALTAIKAAGVRIAVLSNKPDAYTGVLVEQYFPGLVDIAYGQREGVPIKPDPAAVFEIMQGLGCGGEDCAYIGDTAVDMQTGNAAGLHTIGVLWGFRTRKELESADADIIIAKPFELVQNIVDIP